MWSMQALAPRREPEPVRGNDAIDDAYDAWKEADAASRLLQRELIATWERFERGVGRPPSRDLLAEAAWLRNAARERLDHALLLLVAGGHIQPGGEGLGAMHSVANALGERSRAVAHRVERNRMRFPASARTAA